MCQTNTTDVSKLNNLSALRPYVTKNFLLDVDMKIITMDNIVYIVEKVNGIPSKYKTWNSFNN